MQPHLLALPSKQPIRSPQATTGPPAGDTASSLKGLFEDPSLGLGIEDRTSNSPSLQPTNSVLQRNCSTSFPPESMNRVLGHSLKSLLMVI